MLDINCPDPVLPTVQRRWPLTLLRYTAVIALTCLAPGVNADNYRDPSGYYAYFTQATAASPWVGSRSNPQCRTQFEPLYAMRILTLSGTVHEFICSDYPAQQLAEAFEQVRVEELAKATASRAEFEAGARSLNTHDMLLNLLKYAPDAFDDKAWTLLTKTEIEQAQYSGANPLQVKEGTEWVFPPLDLQGRNADIAAEELAADFKAEVLKRASDAPALFVMRTVVGNVKYERDSGMLTFGSSGGRDLPNVFKRPLNAQHNGVDIYSVDANDGVVPNSELPLPTIGLRNIVGPERKPGLIFDRELSLSAIPMPQEQAERLLNTANLLMVNVVLTITDGARRPGRTGIALSSSDDFLFARMERVFVTDASGFTLASFDADVLPLRAAPVAADSNRNVTPAAAAFCRSYESRLATATANNNQRLIATLQSQHTRYQCGL